MGRRSAPVGRTTDCSNAKGEVWEFDDVGTVLYKNGRVFF